MQFVKVRQNSCYHLVTNVVITHLSQPCSTGLDANRLHRSWSMPFLDDPPHPRYLYGFSWNVVCASIPQGSNYTGQVNISPHDKPRYTHMREIQYLRSELRKISFYFIINLLGVGRFQKVVRLVFEVFRRTGLYFLRVWVILSIVK